jgi:hypothetical protein
MMPGESLRQGTIEMITPDAPVFARAASHRRWTQRVAASALLICTAWLCVGSASAAPQSLRPDITVSKVMETGGPNEITRASILQALSGITSFDANGWMGAKNPKGGFSDCMVVTQITGGEFVRVQPAEKGELDCNPDYLTTVTVDPTVEAQKIQ